MKKAEVITIALALGFLIPIIGTTGIIVHSDNTSTSGNLSTSMVYLQPGPDYSAVNKDGFFQIADNNTNDNLMNVDFTNTAGSGTVNLVNVLSIVNKNPAGKDVNIVMNGTLPKGVILSICNSEMISSGSAIEGNNMTNFTGSFVVDLYSNTPGTAFYISFQMDNFSKNTGDLALQYYVR